MSIISGYEAHRFSVVGREYQTTTINKLKGDIELQVFTDCLGLDLYELMKTDSALIDLTSLLEWSAATTYALSDKIFFYDSIMESKAANNLNHNPAHDAAGQYWNFADKFTDENFQELYELYLRDILANKIIKECLIIDTMQVSAKGITMSVSPDQHGNATADVKTIEYQLRHIQSIIDRKIELMNVWLIAEYKKFVADNLTAYDWSIIPFVKSQCSDCLIGQGKGRTRIAFRRNRYDW